MNRKSLALLPLLLAAFALSACGKKAPEEAVVTEDPAVQAQIDENEALTSRQEEINRREAELALKEKEQELARREAALAKSSAPAAARPRPAPTPVATAPAPAPAPAPVASGPKSYTVPSGTSIEVQLPAALSTKTAKVGNRVSANLTNDLVVDGKVIARAGSLLQGSVTEVISGSKQIGGTPTLGLTFDNLTLADGSDTQVNGTVTQVAVKSDKGRDAAKIAGGAVAGAVIGHQVDSDKGKIIGGLLGAAAGTVAARKTGTEVELPAGTVIGFTLTSPVNVTM
ncbi:MAG: glycine zipper 2TM domain-containing protein [Pseudomonadota bacterium]|nr:glycine zipper 2TM domain-containing protein [Pseudomonadota bacterium]